jgi:hypothetical protein
MAGGGRNERILVWILAGIAAIRVFAFSTAFPFFNNVDEKAHFDLVVRYSRGELPRSLVPHSEEAARYIVLYGGPEFGFGPAAFPDGKFFPPLWTEPAEVVEAALKSGTAVVQAKINHEGSSPPLYYALAGAWMWLGKALGISGGFLLYWIRLLNLPLAAALVWLGYEAARLVYPERWLVRLGLPTLLAFYPQDTFYSIQSDVLSPLCFGLAFIGLLKLLRAETPGVKLGALTGLALAGTGLVKATNLPLLAVAGAALLFRAWELVRAGKLWAALPALAALVGCAMLPLGAWFAWNLSHFGDLTGTAAKIQALGWTRKPLAEWWSHPILTLNGAWIFWSELMASFWRGEFTWFGLRIVMPIMEVFYRISSPVLIAAALVGLMPGRGRVDKARQQALWLALFSFAVSVAFLALTSMAFDFGDCFYPSRDHPFFTSGRLLTGALIPFLVLYLAGLDRVLARWNNDRLRLLVLTGIVLLITVSEIKVNRPAFSSQFNWFRLWTEAPAQ